MPMTVLAQKKMDGYKASNGKTYHEGDTIKLGIGSSPNGDFRYLQMAGWAAIASYSSAGGSSQTNIGKRYSGMNVVIKKIQSAKLKGATKVYFTVGGGNITNYQLHIEDAIATCEIADCKGAVPASGNSDLERLKKLKELLDAGTITQAEFDKEKQKILGQ